MRHSCCCMMPSSGTVVYGKPFTPFVQKNFRHRRAKLEWMACKNTAWSKNGVNGLSRCTEHISLYDMYMRITENNYTVLQNIFYHFLLFLNQHTCKFKNFQPTMYKYKLSYKWSLGVHLQINFKFFVTHTVHLYNMSKIYTGWLKKVPYRTFTKVSQER